ncbi:MAG: ABC transporter permease subunit [Nitrososphaeria archaeon]
MKTKGCFDDFPRELIDAARVDGCSRTSVLLRIAIFISRGMIAACGIIAFMWGWQEFIGPLLFIMSEDKKPVTVGLYWFVGDEGILWNQLHAAGIIFFVLMQTYNQREVRLSLQM